ncbi:MAG: hypothetical protein LQ337_005869 [Flavoplaca oasis]|nr:MAG: hypothetical protein LQ337_005869 [Flavoplaca oasis]
MSRLNYDTLSLIFQEVAADGTIHDLRAVAGVCRPWLSAALPSLYRKIVIRFSWGEARKLEKLEAFLRQSLTYGGFVRELEIQGDRHELLERYSPVLIAGLETLKNLTHVS